MTFKVLALVVEQFWQFIVFRTVKNLVNKGNIFTPLWSKNWQTSAWLCYCKTNKGAICCASQCTYWYFITSSLSHQLAWQGLQSATHFKSTNYSWVHR